MLVACGRSEFAPLDAGPAGDDALDAANDAITDAGDALLFYCSFDEASGPYDCGPSLLANCNAQCPSSTSSNHTNGVLFNLNGDLQLVTTAITPAGYTVSIWFRVDTTVTGALISKPADGSTLLDTFAMFVSSSNGRLYFETTDGANPQLVSEPGNIDLRDNMWHHGAATWDGTTKRLYLDGALVGTATLPIVDSSRPIIVGGDIDNGSPAFRLKGAVDELRVYSRPLTGPEISVLAQ